MAPDATTEAEELVCEKIDGDSPQMKALRAWMLRVNRLLQAEDAVSQDRAEELRELTFRATGWEGLLEEEL